MSDLSREGLEAAARGRYAYQVERAPDLKQPPWEGLAPPVQEAYRHEAEASVQAYLSVARSPRDLEAAVEAAAEALRDRVADDRFSVAGLARAALEAALPLLEPEGK